MKRVILGSVTVIGLPALIWSIPQRDNRSTGAHYVTITSTADFSFPLYLLLAIAMLSSRDFDLPMALIG